MPEIKEIVQELGTQFEQFKKANDARIAELQKKGHADPLLEEKVNKLSEQITRLDALKARIDELETKANRPGANQAKSEKDELKAQHKAAFEQWFRKGTGEPELEDLQRKAMNVATPSEGGFITPDELERSIYSLVVDLSPIRQVASVITVGSENYRKLVNLHGATSGWVGETQARVETNTPEMAERAPAMGEIYAEPRATQKILDDSFFNVESFLQQELVTEFAQQEATAFISGNGVNKPRGLLTWGTAATADATRADGVFEHVATGVSGGWPASAPADVLLTITDKLKDGLKQNARWLASGTTFTSIRKFKDGQGQYHWQPGLQAGQASTLFGFPYTQANDMPTIAANSLSLAFGDFRRAYTIVDRLGIRMLRDPYTTKPYVKFYTTKRVGGMVVDFEAVKFLKFAVS